MPKDHCKTPVVTIIFTESTANGLNLEVARLADYVDRSTSAHCYSIRPARSLDEVQPSYVTLLKEFLFSRRSYSDSKLLAGVESSLAFFRQGSFRSNSAESVVSVDDYDNNVGVNTENALPILSSNQVFVRQFVAARTAAHRDFLRMEDNCLVIDVFESQTSVTGSTWSNVCRICHGGSSSGDLLKPCKCKGSIAYTHLTCLERWLKESAYDQCELCNYKYRIIRQPRYSVPLSVMVFLRHPGPHLRELIMDSILFLVYTPSAIITTYMLMLICEAIAKNAIDQKTMPCHLIAFCAIFGMAAIDFMYSTWLFMCLQRHTEAWRIWYQATCELRLILPELRRQPPIQHTPNSPGHCSQPNPTSISRTTSQENAHNNSLD